MAAKLSELKAKFEKLTPGTKEYRDTLALIQAEEGKVKAAETKLAQEKAKKDAQKASKEKKYDLDMIKTLEDYIQKRNDLGQAVPERIQTQYDNLKKKYPDEAAKQPESGYYSGSTFVPGKQSTPTPAAGTPPKTGTPPKGGNNGGNQTPPKTPGAIDIQQRDAALAKADQDFSLPETLFNNIDELKLLLSDYVNSDKNGGQWTLDTFRKKLRDTNWYKNNSAEIKQRYVQLYNYKDQLKGGQDVSNTNYAKEISTLERQIADKARAMGSGIASDPAALRKAAENMYITNVSIDDAMTTDFIAAAIRPIGSTIAGQGTTGYSGQALKDYQAIQDAARANGFRVKDIIPGGQTEQQVLQGIATGKIDPNRLVQDARKLAAQGQPQYVRDLLGQGYNLDQIYSPYRQTMANILEVNPDEIDLNDQTLRSAITDKGDMNIYDFKKTLKRDSRWQYTENAKQEVADVALEVLRDFGFQG